MRRMLLLGATMLIVSFGAGGAGAMSSHQQSVFPTIVELRQATAMRPSLADEQSRSTLPSGAQTVAKAANWGALRGEIGPTLRTAFLLGFAGVVIGLSAVGVKSLWVVEEAEYAALSQDVREEPACGGGRMLTCLGDYPA